MNNVTLIGRLTRDPDVRYNSEHMAIARFSVAVDRPPKDGKKEADYPNCVAFGKTAEVIEKYCKKGKQVGISGRITTGSYEKDGQKIYTTTVAVDRLDLLGGDAKPEAKPETKETQQTFDPVYDGYTKLEEDDLPF